MPNNTGTPRKLILDSGDIELTADNEFNFWPGGYVNTESQQNNGTQTPKTEFKGGVLSNITARGAEEGSVKSLADLMIKTTEGDVDMVVEMSNGDKWSAAVFSTVDTDSFHNTMDGKTAFSLYPRKGKFVQLS